MSADIDKPVQQMYAGYDMRYPVDYIEPDLNYYKTILLNASIFAGVGLYSNV